MTYKTLNLAQLKKRRDLIEFFIERVGMEKTEEWLSDPDTCE